MRRVHVSLAPDGRTLYYCNNLERHRAPRRLEGADGGWRAVQLTKGEEIETYPAALASGRHVAMLDRRLRSGRSPLASSPPPAAIPGHLSRPSERLPAPPHVVPEQRHDKAADGLDIHNQLFPPHGLKPGERRPALIFVHGGPVRQMLLGVPLPVLLPPRLRVNQWLAGQGYVVLSVNYRSGIGYGKSFRRPRTRAQRGNAEYQDVLAGREVPSRAADVDPRRVGIWGLSYGGLLTAQALARNSDIFVAGVDFAGVHLYTSTLDPENVAYKSSAVSAIDTWKSPVLLVHGDDDRNVAFTQTSGLVQLLRARNVYHEVIVFPDDVHESLIHKRWLHTFDRMEQFLDRFVRNAGK